MQQKTDLAGGGWQVTGAEQYHGVKTHRPTSAYFCYASSPTRSLLTCSPTAFSTPYLPPSALSGFSGLANFPSSFSGTGAATGGGLGVGLGEGEGVGVGVTGTCTAAT